MPIYEFQCSDCNRKIEKHFDLYSEMIDWLNSPADSNCDSVPSIFTIVKGDNFKDDCIVGTFIRVPSISGKPIIK